MVHIFTQVGSENVTPKDVAEFFDRNVDAEDQDGHLANRDLFTSLYNDRRLVDRAITSDLKKLISGQETLMYSLQSMVLASSGCYSIRVNIWSPLKERYVKQFEIPNHSYNLAHDHNFNFLTLGYAGPGYLTNIYEYDRDAVKGVIGEKVDLSHVADVQLSEGHSIYFRQGKDIHIQREPDDFSISVNLLITSRLTPTRNQYHFDISNGTISDVANTFAGKRVTLIDMASRILNDEIANLICEVAVNNECPHTASKALDVLCRSEDYHDLFDKSASRLGNAKLLALQAISSGRSGVASYTELMEKSA